MNFLKAWIKRPVTVAMILFVILALTVVALFDARIGPSGDQGRVSYAVIIDYYGVDANRIERDITKPLENAVSVIPGIEEMTSVSEYGKSRVTVTLSAKADNNEVYLLLRDAVDRVYTRLPSSVQKPVIVSSSLEKRPVFIVSFKSDQMNKDQLNQLVEKEVKTSFERIEGTGEIQVGGGEIREIHVEVKSDRASAAGLSVSDIAGAINTEDILLPVGSLTTRLSTTPLVVKGKFTTIDQLKELMVIIPKAGPQKLKNLADIGYAAREKESIARLNGEEETIIYIESSGSANLVSLSRALRTETGRWETRGLIPEVILDTGKKMEESIMQVLNAIIAGVILVIILLALTSGNLRQIIILSILLPLSSLVTIGLLSLFKISLDTFVLAGLAVGIGNIVDGGIVLTEACQSRRMTGRAEHVLVSLREVIPPLFSSVLTTIVVLIPLFFLSDIAEGIRSVTISVGLLMLVSLFFTIIFVPPFFLLKTRAQAKTVRPKKKRKKPRLLKAFSARRFYRLLYASTLFVMKKPKLFAILFAGCFILAVYILFIMGKDLSGIHEEGTVFVHIEYESGDSVEVCDERTNLLAHALKNSAGVERIETNARFGNAEMTVRFNPDLTSRDKVSTLIKTEGLKIPHSFVYVPEPADPLSKKIEVAIMGDDNQILRELASKSAENLGREPWVEQVVLHFKEGPPMKVFAVDPAKLSYAGITTSQIADGLRWALHGPVALKWIENNHEMDLRVMAERENVGSIAALNKTVFQIPKSGFVSLLQLGNFEDRKEESKIYRKNRQRAVFFTVHTRNLELDAAVTKLWQALSQKPLPAGYAYELDKAAAKLSEQFRLMWAVLALALVLIYMILASQAESLLSPILVSATVPLSLILPLFILFLTGQPLSTPILIGLVILTGMAVNNSLLIADLVRENVNQTKSDFTSTALVRPVLFALRKRFRDLLLTSGTSVFGALPLLGLQSNNGGMLSSLSFIVFWGIIGSLIVTLFFLPAFIVLFPRMLKSYSPDAHIQQPAAVPRLIKQAARSGRKPRG
jgi:HAE1 family hydrophobic/amphiphilic exporter-1